MPRRRNNQNRNQAAARNQGRATDGNQTAVSAADVGQNLFVELLNVRQNTPNHGNNNAHVVEQFRRFQPSVFNGRDAPAIFEEWFQSLEHIFDFIGYTDAQRVTCVEFQLIEDADRWWEGYWRTRPKEEREALTWNGFKEIVMQRYYPQSYRDSKEIEFLDLKQGIMSVVEYERKFNQLSRYATHLVDSDIKQTKRFQRGLRQKLE